MSTEKALTPAQLLMLTQWLSPAFPIGAFSYSQGLEQVLATQPDLDLAHWIGQILQHGAGRNDAILIRVAYRGEIAEAQKLGRAFAPSQERLRETSEQGRAFCRVLRDAFDTPLDDLIYPVALGAAARAQALPIDPVVTVYLHSVSSNLIACAQRLSPLGQTRAQAMLGQLSEICQEVSANTGGSTLDDLGGAAWAADIASMEHETLEPRIFRT